MINVSAMLLNFLVPNLIDTFQQTGRFQARRAGRVEHPHVCDVNGVVMDDLTNLL